MSSRLFLHFDEHKRWCIVKHFVRIMSNLLNKLRLAIVELNLFKSGLNQIEIIRRERWSTRAYIILLIITLLVLIIYTALGIETVHVIVSKPSLETYQELSLKYFQTLKCPCSQIAVKYGQFINIQPIYHQVI